MAAPKKIKKITSKKNNEYIITRIFKVKTEGGKVRTIEEHRWIEACKNKLRKEDKAFLSFTDYYNLLIELGYGIEEENEQRR